MKLPYGVTEKYTISSPKHLPRTARAHGRINTSLPDSLSEGGPHACSSQAWLWGCGGGGQALPTSGGVPWSEPRSGGTESTVGPESSLDIQEGLVKEINLKFPAECQEHSHEVRHFQREGTSLAKAPHKWLHDDR